MDFSTLCIIVNYHSADLSLNAVRSVLDSDTAGPVTSVIIDNSEDHEEEKRLRNDLPEKTELVVSDRNLGFGAACNLIVETYDSGCILLLNPDAKMLPGALLRLQKTLYKSKKVAAVGPQVFWDDQKRYFLPPSLIPFFLLNSHFLMSQNSHYYFVNTIVNLIWRNYAIRLWLARTPKKVINLSGGHCLLKREAVKRVGGLFDDRFFLYYEDTDFFMRLRNIGFSLILEPRAEVVHYYNQCHAKTGLSEKKIQMEKSHNSFLRKYSCKRSFFRNALFQTQSNRSLILNEKSTFHSPFSVDIPKNIQHKWLFEWSPNPNIIPAVGFFGNGPRLNFSNDVWTMLKPGRYHGRIGGLNPFLGSSMENFSWIVE